MDNFWKCFRSRYNAGDDMYWGSSNTVIPFNPNYFEIEVRVKKTAGSVVSIVV